MAQTIQLVIVSPDAEVLNVPVDMVILPGIDGDLGILPGHSSLVTSLRGGELTIYTDKKPSKRLFLSGGFAEINGERISLLAESVEDIASFNQQQLQNDIASKTEALNHAQGADSIIAREALQIAQLKLSVSQKNLL